MIRILLWLLALLSTLLRTAKEAAGAGARQLAALGIAAAMAERARAIGVYVCEFRDAQGRLVWRRLAFNVVTDEGARALLDAGLSGSAYTAAWYLALIDASGYTNTDATNTAATHSGWGEYAGISNSTRPAVTWSAASSRSKAGTATFNIGASGTIKGCALFNNATKGGTTGTLYSAGSFSGGDQAVTAGGTLTVTYTARLT